MAGNERDEEKAREQAEIRSAIWSAERGVPLPALRALSHLINGAKPAETRVERAIEELLPALGRWSLAIVQCRMCKALHTATWEVGQEESTLQCYSCKAPACHPVTAVLRGPEWKNPLEGDG